MYVVFKKPKSKGLNIWVWQRTLIAFFEMVVNIMKMVCQMEESNPLTLESLGQNIIFAAEDKSEETWIDSQRLKL